MKVLVIGSGAREHALVWKCVQSELVERVYCAPGNGGTGGMARNIPIGAADVVRIVDFAKRERLGLIGLGPEAAVDAGVGDALRHAGFNVFGPDRGAGRIESSKSFAKALMKRAGIPTADFEVFTQPAPAKAWARERSGRVAVKADGLARGKGVIVCADIEQSDGAIEAMLVQERFGRSGKKIVVEERLEGPELSLLAVTDGADVIPLAPARDYKRAHEGDLGANTGGMGAYSPPKGVDDAMVQEVVDRVMRPAVRALAESGQEFRGVLYAGLMLTPQGIRTLEFNARFGDPEAQVVLPRLQSDFVALALAAAKGGLATHPDLRWDPRGVMEWATGARSRGLKVVIAAAGGAAHLPGVVAAWTDLPVIGVPVPTQHLGGLDSLYSIVQMPAGVPVATVAIGEAGAKNAAWLAARIIGLNDVDVEQRHGEKRAALAT